MESELDSRKLKNRKIHILRSFTAIASAITGGAIYFHEHEFYWGAILWPSIYLARLGVGHSWILIPFLLGGWLCLVNRQASRHGHLRFAFSTILIVGAYYVSAHTYMLRAAMPAPPMNRYWTDSKQSLAYQKAYGEGYRDGLFGVMTTYCFRPEPETIGSYEGARDGYTIWCRMRGSALSGRESRLFQSSAGVDGVNLPAQR